MPCSRASWSTRDMVERETLMRSAICRCDGSSSE
jgi:hypothetical protein